MNNEESVIPKRKTKKLKNYFLNQKTVEQKKERVFGRKWKRKSIITDGKTWSMN